MMPTRIKRKFADIVALIPGKCTLSTEAHKATARLQESLVTGRRPKCCSSSFSQQLLPHAFLLSADWLQQCTCLIKERRNHARKQTNHQVVPLLERPRGNFHRSDAP